MLLIHTVHFIRHLPIELFRSIQLVWVFRDEWSNTLFLIIAFVLLSTWLALVDICIVSPFDASAYTMTIGRNFWQAEVLNVFPRCYQFSLSLWFNGLLI